MTLRTKARASRVIVVMLTAGWTRLCYPLVWQLWPRSQTNLACIAAWLNILHAFWIWYIMAESFTEIVRRLIHTNIVSSVSDLLFENIAWHCKWNYMPLSIILFFWIFCLRVSLCYVHALFHIVCVSSRDKIQGLRLWTHSSWTPRQIFHQNCSIYFSLWGYDKNLQEKDCTECVQLLIQLNRFLEFDLVENLRALNVNG